MIIIPIKQREKHIVYKLTSLCRDIFHDKHYIKININKKTIILKNHWWSLSKTEYSFKEFCVTILPNVMINLIASYEKYEYDIDDVIKAINIEKYHQSDEHMFIDYVYRKYNLLLCAICTNEQSIAVKRLKEPSIMDLIHIQRQHIHMLRKESEVDSIIKTMKKSLKVHLLYLPDRISR